MHTVSNPYAARATQPRFRTPGECWLPRSSVEQPTPTMPPEHSGLDATHLVNLMGDRRKVRLGECLYHQQDQFHYFYAVRSGSFKSTLTSSDGCEQVSNFHMTGELLGLDGVAEGRHASSAAALEDSEVSKISYGQFKELSMTNSCLQLTVIRLISQELVRGRLQLVILGNGNANQRLAAFLLDHSTRLAARGYSAIEFHLKMTRAEIASFLGLALETVSRALSEMQQLHVLKVERRHIQITDLMALKQLQF